MNFRMLTPALIKFISSKSLITGDKGFQNRGGFQNDLMCLVDAGQVVET